MKRSTIMIFAFLAIIPNGHQYAHAQSVPAGTLGPPMTDPATIRQFEEAERGDAKAQREKDEVWAACILKHMSGANSKEAALLINRACRIVSEPPQ